jgi:hypothetical protein
MGVVVGGVFCVEQTLQQDIALVTLACVTTGPKLCY